MENNFKNNLKYFRGKEQITQQQLADAVGISQKNIGSYEDGRCAPRLNTLIKLADHFGITVDELIRIRQKKSIKEFNPIK